MKASEAEVEKKKQELCEFKIDKKKWQAIQKSLKIHSYLLNDHFELFLKKLGIYQNDKNLKPFFNTRLNFI